jgi:hypothetical protein
MAHYVFVENGIVVDKITGVDENSTLPEGFDSWEAWYGNKFGMTCKRTSYNTEYGVHTNGGTAFRGNFAGVGDIYDEDNDVFYPPAEFDSWTINTTTWKWEPPIPMPTEHPNNYYEWNEEAYQADTADPKTEGWQLSIVGRELTS